MSRKRRIVIQFIAYIVFILILVAEVIAVLAKLPKDLNSNQILALLGRVTGLWAATFLIMQFVLSSRLKILDKIFGIDRLMIFHRFLGASALTLATLHPFILYHSDFYVSGPLKLERWPVILGAVILTIIILLVCTSIFRTFLKLDYRYWRIIHQFAFGVVILVAIHALVIGSEFQSMKSKVLCFMILFAYTTLFIWVKFIKSHKLKNNPFEVTEVTALNQNVVNIKLKPVKMNLFEYLPGQFAFLRLFNKGTKPEEHPFTISSSPLNRNEISFTIKNLGDYTSTIGQTKVGDKASIEAPLGRFSFMSYPKVEQVILIAGGIGITPLLSMLRYLAKKDSQKHVNIIWANRTINDTFLQEEFDYILNEMPNLKIHHIMSREPDYSGLKGHLNEENLNKLLSPVIPDSKVFLCGPVEMMKSVKQSLRKIGFAKKQIITENFVL